jgi:hypothetical protein
MKKKLLAGGCSYTNRPHRKTPDIIFWPEFVAEDLNLEGINIGRSGAGNDFIFNSIVRGITESDDIELVVVLWTQIFRLDCWNFQKNTMNILVDGCRDAPNGLTNGIHQTFISDVSKIFLEKLDDHYWLDQYIINYFLNITTLRNLCNKLGIKLIMAQAQEFEPYHRIYRDLLDTEHFFKQFMNQLAWHSENSKNFIGWPILRELGGYALQQHGKDIYKSENRISDNDWHPNTKGHRIIADEIYNKYKKLYT